MNSGVRGLVTALAVGAALVAALPSAPVSAEGRQAAHGRGNPFAGSRLYVDPRSHARLQAERWAATRPADAAVMARLARRPHAGWFGEGSADIRSAVAGRVRTAARAGALPVLVAYRVPFRDCGAHSAGGARSSRAYRRWIRGFAAGVAGRRAAVVLEPDALAGLDCLSARRRRERLGLLRYAVRVLAALPGVAVYLDAGHSAWQSAAVAARRLRAAGVSRARGFSLNVSNFRTTADEIAYGSAVSARVGGKPFVVDTSRNGAGPARGGEWCNPPGRALGRPPTARTGRRLVDAYLWIKVAGESDGPCRGGPPAGAWWPSYALELARRASP